MPATKPFRSATWASTLWAWMTSARCPRAPVAGRARAPKNSVKVGMPRSSRATSRDVARRLDAQHRDACAPGSTAAGSRRCSRSRRPGCHGRARARRSAARASVSRVREHRVGERGEVEVVAEQLLGRHGLGDLHQRAVPGRTRARADTSARAVRAASAVSKRVRQRRAAEREDQQRARPRRTSGSAGARLMQLPPPRKPSVPGDRLAQPRRA